VIFYFNFSAYPEEWTLPNFAALLVSSPVLSRVAIFNRASHGSVLEAGSTLCSCVEVLHSLCVKNIELLEYLQMAIRFGRDPSTTLWLTMKEIVTKCSRDICLQVFSESVRTAQALCTDFFSGDLECKFLVSINFNFTLG
jgi:hypothetical protein